jgi:hypothetical protein
MMWASGFVNLAKKPGPNTTTPRNASAKAAAKADPTGLNLDGKAAPEYVGEEKSPVGYFVVGIVDV